MKEEKERCKGCSKKEQRRTTTKKKTTTVNELFVCRTALSLLLLSRQQQQGLRCHSGAAAPQQRESHAERERKRETSWAQVSSSFSRELGILFPSLVPLLSSASHRNSSRSLTDCLAVVTMESERLPKEMRRRSRGRQQQQQQLLRGNSDGDGSASSIQAD